MMKLILALVVCFQFLNFSSYSQSLFQPDNLNFEKSIAGYKPVFWTVSSKLEEAGCTVLAVSEDSYEGHLSLEMKNPLESNNSEELEKNTLPVYQILDAITYRNKTVRLSVYAKLVNPGHLTTGELWAIGRSTKENVTISEYMEKNPVLNTNWQKYEITFFVPAETNELRFGIMLKGQGTLKADDFHLEIIQPEGAKDEPAKKLSSNEISNLCILSNLYGYLNYFNPANNLNDPEKEKLLFWAIQSAEKVTNNNQLISLLNKYAKMTSPMAVINNDEKMDIEYNQPNKKNQDFAYLQKYTGGPVDRSDELFSSVNANIFASTRKREASVVQIIEALKYKSKKVKISASIKVEQASPGANAQIWVRADRIGSKEYVAAASSETPAMLNNWKKYETTLELPENIYTIKLALVFMGEGKAFFDDIKIEVFEKDKKTDEISLRNSSFEIPDSTGFPAFWNYDMAVINAGYSLRADSSDCTKGKVSLVMESDSQNRVNFPLIGRVYSNKIGAGLYLHHPYIYYGNQNGVYNSADSLNLKVEGKPDGYNSNYKDRFSRIAAVIKLNNILKHFSINNINQTELDSALSASIAKASEDNSAEDFLKTIKSMLVLTNDQKAIVWSSYVSNDFSFPFIINEIDGKILVSSVIDSTLGISPGDEVVSVGGKNIRDALNEYIKYTPGNNERFKLVKALVELRAGPEKSTEKFTFRKQNGTEITVNAVRNELIQNVSDQKPSGVIELDSGYIYVNLTEMSDVSLKGFIEPMAQRKAYIFDMRGLSNVSEYLLGFFTKDSINNAKWEVPVYTFPNKENTSVTYFGVGKFAGSGKFAGKKAVFLINDKTTGYAEAIVSIIKANNICKIAGQPTSGNASEVMAFRLPAGYNVSMSGLKVYSPDGKQLFGNSVQPDITINPELNHPGDELDNYIKEALKYLKN